MNARDKNVDPGRVAAEPVPAAPPIVLEAFLEYLLGFPMLVAVTCENPSTTRTFGNLLPLDIFTAPGPVEFVFASTDGKRIVLPAASPAHSEGPYSGGFTLHPGEARRMLFDISLLDPSLSPGAYQLEASYRRKLGASTAPPVQVTLTAPSRSDAEAAAELRKQNDLKQSSWSNFLEFNWRTVDASKLSAKGQEALALHLFLHRAIYGPTKVADLDPDAVNTFAKGPLEGEAAVLRLEILTARGDAAAAAEEAKVLKRWPGLKWRIEEIKGGEGLLTSLRRSRGAEQSFSVPPDFYPYTDKK